MPGHTENNRLNVDKPWISTFIANAIIFVSGLISGIIAARILGVEDRGLLATIIFWPHFLTGIGAMGLNEATAIHTSRSGTNNRLYSSVFSLSVILAVLLIIACSPFIQNLLGETRRDYVGFTRGYFSIFIPLSFIALNLMAIDQGTLLFNRFNSLRVLQSITYPTALVVFWVGGVLNVKTAAIAVLLGTCLVAFVKIYQVRDRLNVWPSRGEMLGLFGMGVRLHITNVVMFAAGQTDRMIMVLLANDRQVGFYVVALTAASAAQSLFVRTFTNIMLPVAARSGESKTVKSTYLKPLRWFIACVALVSIVMIVAIPVLLPFVFGVEFAPAIFLAQILTVAFIFIGLKSTLIYLLRAWGNNRAGAIGETVTIAVFLATSYPALHVYGSAGVASMVVLSHIIGTSVILCLFSRHVGFSVVRALIFTRLPTISSSEPTHSP